MNETQKMSFQQWYEELENIFEENDMTELKECDQECWREYYDDGDTPEEAFQEDISYRDE